MSWGLATGYGPGFVTFCSKPKRILCPPHNNWQELSDKPPPAQITESTSDCSATSSTWPELRSIIELIFGFVVAKRETLTRLRLLPSQTAPEQTPPAPHLVARRRWPAPSRAQSQEPAESHRDSARSQTNGAAQRSSHINPTPAPSPAAHPESPAATPPSTATAPAAPAPAQSPELPAPVPQSPVHPLRDQT